MSTFDPKFKTLVDIFQSSVRNYADRPLFGQKQGGTWKWSTYGEFARKVDQLRSALDGLGVGAGDRVAIISNNRPEWAMAAYATYGLGASFAAMYEAQTDADWRYILRDCGAKVLFVPGLVIAQRVAAMRGDLPDLQHIIVLEGPTDKDMHSFERVLADGDKRPVDVRQPKPEDIACFIYTSGTTGNPKGVMLSHANIAYNVCAILDIFPLTKEDRSLCFLPWAHVFGQSVELHGLFSLGASLAFAESVEKIIENIGEVRPTILFSVPRVFNKIYDGLNRKMAQEGGLKKKLFDAAMKNEERRKELAARRETSGLADFKHSIFDKLVFSKVRDRFGGRLRYAVSGGAALSKEVAEFIDNLGILVFEGYGLSETSPIVTANYPGARKIGSVGKCIPGVEVEIDTGVTGDPKNGEIIAYGHNVMQGYHGLPQENAKVFVEKNGKKGFRTGDMGYVDGEGFLHITGRIKEQYKLLNGKYVVPTPLEEELQLSPFISSAMIWGDNQEYNVAVIIPTFDALKSWAAEHGIPGDPKTLVEDERVKQLFADEIEKHSQSFRQYEKIRRFVLGATDFTTDNGMLTATLKLKRREVFKHYGDALKSLY